jgi:hypothetical protein
MYNDKFIIHNSTKHYKDYEIFDFITYCLKQGLLSNEKTEYCYCIVRQCENWDLLFESHKTNKGYRFDVIEVEKENK